MDFLSWLIVLVLVGAFWYFTNRKFGQPKGSWLTAGAVGVSVAVIAGYVYFGLALTALAVLIAVAVAAYFRVV